MTEILDNLPPAVLLVLALLLVVWLVLLLLVPFMIESIRGWTRKSYVQLEQLNAKIDRLVVLLEERPPERVVERVVEHDPYPIEVDRPAREPRAERVRREPTISG
jgi:hypothetical protein